MFKKDEWTQQELYKYTKELEKQNTKVFLIDTILKPIDNIETMLYNPYEMASLPENSVFVFYCDTGKTSKERLNYYKKKFPKHNCVSLRGGRAYWRPNYQLLEELKND